MERRVLLAIFLCFLVLYGYQALFVKPVPKQPAIAAEGAAGSAAQGTGAPASAATSAAPAAPIQALSATPAPGTTSLVGDTEERDVRVETPHVIAVFTNRGARLKSWRLKQYRDAQGEPVELIANELAATQPLPFSLRAADDAATGSLNGALYTVTGAPAAGTIQSTPTNLTFEYRDSAGLHAVKTFTLDPGTYTVALNAAVTQGDQAIHPAIVWGPGLGDSDSQTGRYAVKPAALYSAAGKVTRLAISSRVRRR
jgi:YidC/Oxa1 family membrane protein insertase